MDYRIVIPSRKRADTIGPTLNLLKGATVVVRYEEEEEYMIKNPGVEIVALPKDFQGGIAKIRAWIMNFFTEHTIIMCDDDLYEMRCLVGQRERIYKDAEVIRKVLENSIQITKDLGISLFYYNRDANPLTFKGTNPVQFYGGFAAGLFGINGRKIKFDTNLTTREDVDITLQALLLDRIIYSDLRFYFNFGPVWKGKGGNQGIRTSDTESFDKEYLYEKWGRACLNMDMRKKGSTGVRNLVKRRSLLTNTE